MLVETLTTTVGGAASRALLKLWLKDSELARRANLTLSQLIGKRVKGTLEKKRLRRGFERIGEEVAEQLEPLLDAEFGGLPDNEQQAAMREVVATLDGAPLSDDVLFAEDLDPVRLEDYFRSTRPDAAERALLVPAAAELYAVTLREICHYLVEIVVTLPNFESRQAHELLKRDTELIDLVHEVLARLPDGSGWGDDAEQFGRSYRRELLRKFDYLELFGVTASELSRRYSLSVAYLMLEASSPSEDEASDEEGRSEAMPVDEALAPSYRTLLRGEAGSGKTTVLQWLAVSATRRNLGDALEEWGDCTPFLLKLRRFANQELPQPEDFVAEVNRTLAERAPAGWVQGHLQAGTALVLIDGVDELPEEQRDTAREWLRDLIATYPDARYVVTSRPAAAGDDWLARDGFEPAFIEPMDASGIRAFIEHWHRAVRGELRDQEAIEALDDLERKLQKEVRERAAVRDLATSPLLCALLCALNRDRRANLPGDRIKLYAIALEMLLDRRETERGVPTTIDIGDDERELILGHLAFWLLANEKSDLEREQAIALIEDRIEGMHRFTATAEEVYENLLQRSGLLRQPVEGRIDFIHRTFQEYLGAREAMRRHWVGLLVEKAHLDQWREVVVLAAGLASLEQREELIQGLLDRAYEQPDISHRLELLAVACLETSPELSPRLSKHVESVLDRLIPPHNMTEARALASAGELAVPLLAERGHGRATVTAATVRALSLIGGEGALAGLERYGDDKRVTVARELVRAWDFFPTDEYARRVLASSVLDGGKLSISDGERLAALRHLRGLVWAKVFGRRAVDSSDWEWGSLKDAQHLERLQLFGIRGLPAAPPSQFPQVKRLLLSLCPDTVRLAPLEPGLESLRIVRCPELRDVTSLADADGLRDLSMVGLGMTAMPPLPPMLRSLEIEVVSLTSLDGLAQAAELSELRLQNLDELTDIDDIVSLSGLRSLRIADCPLVDDLAPVAGATELERLALIRLGDIDPAPLANLTGLQELIFVGSNEPMRLDWLADTSELDDLRLVACHLETLEPLSHLTSLRALNVANNSSLVSLAGIEPLTRLTNFTARSCRQLTDVTALAGAENLRMVDLQGCDSLTDLAPIAELPNISLLDLRGCQPTLGLGQIDTGRVQVLRTMAARAAGAGFVT